MELQKRKGKNDPERTKEDILAVATEEFATNGLSGGRVDAIAARTRTTKRMIYYYFGSKEQLYLAVLEKVYGDIRTLEKSLHLEELAPVDAIRRLVEFTFDYQDANPDFIRLVAIENIHRAKFIKESPAIGSVSAPLIETIAGILKRGRDQGVFRAEIDALDLHFLISAFCYFRVSNQYTFGAIFKRDLSSHEVRERHRRMIGDAIIAFLTTGADGTLAAPLPVKRSRSVGRHRG